MANCRECSIVKACTNLEIAILASHEQSALEMLEVAPYQGASDLVPAEAERKMLFALSIIALNKDNIIWVNPVHEC